MKHLLVICLLSLLASFTVAAERAEKIKVLVVTGGHGFEREPFFKIFQDNPEITFTEAVHGKGSATAFERDDLTNFDVVVLYDLQNNITDAEKKNFLALFQKGVGLVVLHHALVSYQHWPEYERIIGGHYPEEDGKGGVITAEVGYQNNVEIPATIVAPHHPVTAGLKDFTIRDEIYWGFRVGKDVQPLVSTTQPKSGKPLAWARTEGKSRIVYIQSGHGPSAFENPNYRQLVAQAIHWTAK
jgi:type 1 glutamine amidotransferase